MDKPKAGPPSEQLHLPAGFRFHPTDEELVVHYLAYKAESRPFPIPIIAEVDLYKFDPWDLPEKAFFGEREWYFFSPRDRKYPNGARPNRAAASGYWKATGTDKPILSKSKKVGVKKALVFYKGRAPKGVKTNWIMHEYRLAESKAPLVPARRKGSLRLDDWVLCRIYKKSSGAAFKVMVSAPNMAVKSEPEEDLEDVLASLPDIDGSDNSRFKMPQWGGGGGGGNFATPFMPSDQQMIEELFSDEQDTSENASGSFDQAMSYHPSSLTNHDASYSEEGMQSQMVMMNKLNSWAYDTQFQAATAAAPATPRSFKVVNPPPIKLERVPSNISDILLQIQNSRKRLRVDDEDDVQSTCRSPVPRPKQGFGFMDFSTGSHQMLF